MPKRIVMEEFHLTVRAPRGLANSEYDAICKTLASRLFQTRLRRAVRKVVGEHPELAQVKVELSR